MLQAAALPVYDSIMSAVQQAGCRRPLLVCGHSFMKNPAYDKLVHSRDIMAVPFHDYEPNPKYESVVKGLHLFQEQHCDMLVSVGGGSPMDVAKSIKAFDGMAADTPYITQSITANSIPHLAVPTTAGTGSEATHFAVVYYEGKKYSVAHESLTPDYVVLNPTLLSGLPLYQRKATMLDALCHAIESYWSVRATPESQKLAGEAIETFLSAYKGYLNDTVEGNRAMLHAANLAGKAINMTTTTAAHAMSYKLTGLYGIAHGHAASLCLTRLWPYMLTHLDQTADARGAGYVARTFQELAALLGQPSPEEGARFMSSLMHSLDLPVPTLRSQQDLDLLSRSVNLQRLSNNPVALQYDDLYSLYQTMLCREN